MELVNARENPDGTLTETEERTNLWAWRHPHQADGTVTYTKLEGDVTFNDVDFGYNDEKIVLHNIKLYAAPTVSWFWNRAALLKKVLMTS